MQNPQQIVWVSCLEDNSECYQRFAEERIPIVLCQRHALQSFTAQECSSQGLDLSVPWKKSPGQKFVLQVFKRDRKENLEKHIVVSALQSGDHCHLSTAMREGCLNSSWGNQVAQTCCWRGNNIQQLGCLQFAWTSLIKSCQADGEDRGMAPWFFCLANKAFASVTLFYVVVLVLNFFRKYRLEQKNLALPHLLKYSI